MRRALIPHPATSCPAIDGFWVEAERTSDGRLQLRYEIEGRIGELRLPDEAEPARADELWRATCFEAFVRAPDAEAYLEANLAPSRQWATYDFDAYRAGMRPALEVGDPAIALEDSSDSLALSAALNLAATPLAASPWRVGLSAVIQTGDGRTSYWALAHPPGRPDFHHPDCFALEIPAPVAA